MIKKLALIFIIIVINYTSIKQTKQIDPVIDRQTIQDIESVEEENKEKTPPTYKIKKRY